MLRYQDDRSKQKIKTLVKNAAFSGEFSDTKFSVASNSNLFLHYLRSEGEDYLKNRQVSYDAKVDVDMEAGTYDFKRVSLVVNGNEFIVDGHLDVEDLRTKVDICVMYLLKRNLPMVSTEIIRPLSSKSMNLKDFLLENL